MTISRQPLQPHLLVVTRLPQPQINIFMSAETRHCIILVALKCVIKTSHLLLGVIELQQNIYVKCKISYAINMLAR